VCEHKSLEKEMLVDQIKEEAPWIFVLRDEILPGRFSIQPIQPSVLELIERDPKGDILFHSHVALLAASAQYEAYRDMDWWARSSDIETFALFVVESLKRMLNLKKVFVIPQEEFNRRVARGEFEETRIPTEDDRLKMGIAFHETLQAVLENYYSGLSRDRQGEVLLRMRPADVDGIRKLWGFCAIYDDENGGLRYRYISRPEVQHLNHRALPLVTHRRGQLKRFTAKVAT
jgi:hypothetical protein